MDLVTITPGSKIDSTVLDLINQATFFHFGDPPLLLNQISDSIFFTILHEKELLATGRLHPIQPVMFDDNKYSIMAIGGILANEKLHGYGSKIMKAISDCLAENDKTGIGFCVPSNKMFYVKCGIKLNTKSIKQFRFPEEYGKQFLEDSDTIIYQEGSDQLMSKVSTSSDKQLFFPCHPW